MAEALIIIEKYSAEAFSLIFQQGFMIKVRTGESVRDILCDQLGLSNDYIEKRISTIFLDGKPVDDIDSSHVKDKAVLSLSAAMPGLVGATMRRGGFYSSFRNAITYREDNSLRQNADGMISIKLFNIIAREIGMDLLRKGIFVSSDDIKLLLENKDYNFKQNCVRAFMDGKETDCESLLRNQLPLPDMICIKVNS